MPAMAGGPGGVGGCSKQEWAWRGAGRAGGSADRAMGAERVEEGA